MTQKPNTSPDFLKFAGRRKGRPLREGRHDALDVMEKGYCIPREIDPHKPTDPKEFFGTMKPEKIWLEIGFGNGEHLIGQAARHPGIGFIGCEPFINGVSAAAHAMIQQKLHNVRFWADDAMLLLPHLKKESFDRIFLLFSDPWPKTRQHKRRVIQPKTVELFASLLKPGGELRLATDHANLAEWMLIHVTANPHFMWKSFADAQWRETPDDWIETRYQQKAAQQGRLAYFMDFTKR